jgi:hypothetical protein
MAAQASNSDSNARKGVLAFTYALTIFISAFLLFQIQPMISKAILPWFGGTPAVWTICLLFFQSLLFAGYAYAHFTNAWLSPGKQAFVHIVVLVAALALLNVLPSASMQPTGDADPTKSILIILGLTIGLPYFVLSATGPLLQAWFARSFPGRTPYRLYALSNVGSLLALLSYPFIFERQFNLQAQSNLWAGGFIVFALLCAFAAWSVRKTARVATKLPPSLRERGKAAFDAPLRRAGVPAKPSTAEPEVGGILIHASGADDTEPSASHVLGWLVLPAFASIVLIATTNHISTDVAVVPMLWIVPLALYLLTFIIAFDRPSWFWPTTIAVLTLIAIYPTSALYKNNNVGTIRLYKLGMTGTCIKTAVELFHQTPILETDESPGEGPKVKIGFRTALFVNFAAMFGICLLCHGQLARLKPSTNYLTAYYLMMSAGGALGGIAVSLIAPRVFHTIFEWKLAIFVAAVACIGMILSNVVGRMFGAVAINVPTAPSLHPTATATLHSESPRLLPRFVLLALLVPFAFVMLDLTEFLFSPRKSVVYESRNFFGALTICETDPQDLDKDEIILLNGTTRHGTQFVADDRRTLPTSYYAHHSGIGLVLDYFRQNRPPGGIRIGDVGLGAGTLAAYAQKYDHIVFYEINPTVVEISSTGKWFTYISDCKRRGAHCDIRLGDARLTIQKEAEAMARANEASASRSGERPGEGRITATAKKQLPYHVLVLDAFTGDAVPTHLLTTEAMDIYRPLIATEATMGVDGALLIHVSNRYLDLDRVARGCAEHLGFECLEIRSTGDEAQSINSADWVVLTKNKDLAEKLSPHAAKPSPDDKPPILWTDAHSSLFEILR